MNNLQQFTNGNFNLPVRQLSDGSIEFDAEHAAIGLGICRTADSGNMVVRWDRVRKYLSCPQVGMGDFITEPQFYKLAIKANNETAERFQDWVTNEVLPSIRKEGAYVTPQTAFDWMSQPDNMIKFLERYRDAQQENQRLHDENTVMQPKALFADAVSASHTTILVGELAKLLKQNGIDIGQNRLFAWMRANGYLIHRKGTDWNMPTQRSMQQGLFKVKETSIAHSNGSVTVSKTVKVTGKGQQYFINKFLNDDYLDA